ncbi:glycosyl hydrolase 53 family protein [Paenibacillus sp. GCM10027628]|uniref:glycosyl hydrolase 53 family protein n=1 Tax=Paenibacillus sp. GCM10027628 TaxID=3273413 RepID=UPI00363344C0
MKKSLAIALGIVLASGSIPAAFADESVSQSIKINPIQGISPDFIKGADVSMLKQIEQSGGKFYDQGVEKEALQILKDHGVNWVRLRIWNHPFDKDGNPLGGGNNDKARTVEIAKRAKALGLKVLLDFHYSDFWADPSKQNKPAEWEGKNTEELQQALYDYTADVIHSLVAEGAMPEMVQIGNETNTGMVWPDGQTTGSGGYEGWANLVKKGVQAVRDHDPNNSDPAKKTKIMIHLADGGNNELFRRNFDQLQARGVDYDVIGFSYYPYWHGPMNQLQQNMEDISKRYNKEVLVAENAYAYTLDDADHFSNNFGPGQEQLGGYKATVQGQAQEVRDVMNAVVQVSDHRGLGVFYWEPDWIPVKGAEWSSKEGEGNGWENQAMFDFNGNALPSLDVFNRVSTPVNGDPFVAAPTFIQPVDVHVTVGGTLLLPNRVKVTYTDDSIREMPVTWDQLGADALNHPGTVTLQGTVTGVAIKASGTILVQGAANLVKNPGFESGDNSNWTITGDNSAVKVTADSANAHASSYALHYSLPQAMPFMATQTITGLPNGSYTLKVWSHGGGGENSLKLFAGNYGGEEKTADIQNTGWLQWKHPIVMDIQVTNGQATIGVKADGNAGNWGNIDDFEFYTDSSAENLNAPVQVKKGSGFTVGIGNGGLVDTIYAEDVTAKYDADKFDYQTAQSSDPQTVLLQADHSAPGRIRLLIAHVGGKSMNMNSVNLTFTAKTNTNAADGTIAIEKAEWGTAPAGAVIVPASFGSARILLTNASSGDSHDSAPGYSQTASQASSDDPIQLGADGSVMIVQKAAMNVNQTAVASLSAERWKQMMERAGADQGNQGKIVLEISKVEGAVSYEQKLPRSILTALQADQQIEIKTPLGTVSASSQMLNASNLGTTDDVSLYMETVKPDAISEALKKEIGGKPVVELIVKSGAERIPWNNPGAPVTVSIPYSPTAEELQSPDHLTVYYLDGAGHAVAVPNAHYDSASGSVVFTTTHFSSYAVAFVKASFGDLANYEWARKAVESLASKGVTNGTSAISFSPERPVSRAEYLVMLTRALGLTAKTGANFIDVHPSDDYFEVLAVAKALGIAEGGGDNRFHPEAPISREDVMVLTARALQHSKKFNSKDDVSILSRFNDQSEISDYAASAVAALVKKGVIDGNVNGIAPQAETTRAEAAVIIYRSLQP